MGRVGIDRRAFRHAPAFQNLIAGAHMPAAQQSLRTGGAAGDGIFKRRQVRIIDGIGGQEAQKYRRRAAGEHGDPVALQFRQDQLR